VSSNRLRRVYGSSDWKRARRAALERAQNRCEREFTNVFGETTRCPKTSDLTVDHMDPYFPDPLDLANLQVLCRKHHGEKDGGRAAATPKAVW
jgi:5-methylcytosine-specific restriction endonuclease McrA